MTQPTPARVFQTVNAYRQTAAMKAARELGVFTTAGAVHTTAEAQAAHCHVSMRAMRVLCDYLVILEFLTKKDTRYGLVPDEAAFLDRIFQTYMGESSVSCFPLS